MRKSEKSGTIFDRMELRDSLHVDDGGGAETGGGQTVADGDQR